MLDKLHTNELLRKQLTTRETDDPAIALLDAWAMVGDVLTFYQERIANEGYLRTAIERRSVLEMARTIGYELNPGVAASTYLAFTVDDSSDLYAEVTIPEGTQVQSIPAQGKLPQTFETSEKLEAHVEWNALEPRLTIHQTLAIGSDGKLYLLSPNGDKSLSGFYLVNPDASLKSDETVKATEISKLYLKGIANKLEAGDLILLAGVNGKKEWQTLIKPIVSIEVDKKLDRTVVQLDTGSQLDTSSALTHVSYAEAKAEYKTVTYAATGLSFNSDNIKTHFTSKDIDDKTFRALMDINRWDQSQLMAYIQYIQTAVASISEIQGVFAFREHVGFFGNNAPAWTSLPETQRYDKYYIFKDNKYIVLEGKPVYYPDWDTTEGWEIWKKHPSKTCYSEKGGADVFLERKVEGIAQNGWAVFESPGASLRYTPYLISDTRDESITGFSLSGKATGLKLSSKDGLAPTKSTELKVRNTTAHVKSERLELAALPIDKKNLEESKIDDKGVTTTTGASQLMLNRMVTDFKIGKPVIISGELVDPEGVDCQEVAILKNISHSRGYTVLLFQKALQYCYVLDTVTVNANVVPATHGETIKDEVLGNGAGTKTNQCFELKKPPLTYVSASTPSGSDSTLTVKVDNIEWEEASSLYGLNECSRNYIVRLNNEGEVSITFGDGKQGARLPTGQENVTATYRSGIGFDGEVEAESLTLLKTRPQGIRSVTNPMAASGADEPETMDDARTNAPLTVLTMERIVSLRDYEDFARAFTGIGKAQATVLWDGETDLVHITIASSKGGAVESTSSTYQNLTKAIDKYRNQMSEVRVDTFEPRYFCVKARVLIDSKYTASIVLSEAEEALKSAFSFAKRDFGQPVTSAEVTSTIQKVPGVVYVDLDKLYLTNDENGPSQTSPASVLSATKADWPQGGNFQRAQLLLIHTAGITLEEIKS